MRAFFITLKKEHDILKSQPALHPADKVEKWPIEKLVPYARNSRTHSEEQIAQLAASIKEWGFTTAVLVDEAGGIIAGHGRVLAARKLGMEQLPVMVAKGWTKTQKQAYIIADNRLALNAGWDNEMLTIELNELLADGFALEMLGFDPAEMQGLVNGGPDFAPATEDDQGKLDQLDPKWIACPHCGKEFDAREA